MISAVFNTLKKCRYCSQVKEFCDFDKNQHRCKKCTRIEEARRKEKRVLKIFEIPENFTKVCTSCKLDLHFKTFRQKKGAPLNLNQVCRICELKATNIRLSNNKKKYKQLAKISRDKSANKIIKRNWRILKDYGLSQQQYDDLFIRQNFKCAICCQPPKEGKILFVDHLKNSNPVKIRGLLCNLCNSALGMVDENIEIMTRLQNYLNSFNEKNYLKCWFCEEDKSFNNFNFTPNSKKLFDRCCNLCKSEKIHTIRKKVASLDDRNKWYIKKYGITVPQILDLLARHDNKCCGCEQLIINNYNVDHCHSTGRVRGILCQKCNTFLGFSKNSSILIEHLKNYLFI